MEFCLRCVVVCFLVGACAPELLAQGTPEPVVMRTGVGIVLQTQAVPFPTMIPVELDFGFATQEKAQPGLLADSFTVSLQSSAGIIYLLTADANGVQWAPVVPGAVPISETSIQRASTEFLVPTEGLTPTGAYELRYDPPTAWEGLPLTINFDLFDNQNPDPSLAYFSVIPEPSSTLLLVLGAAVGYLAGSARRVGRRS